MASCSSIKIIVWVSLVISIKERMAFGKLRKIWEKIKNAGRKAYGFVKNTVLPIAKKVAPAIATAVGSAYGVPQAGAIVQKGLDVADSIFNASGGAPAWPERGSKPKAGGQTLAQRLSWDG
jgi:hypothetical protein